MTILYCDDIRKIMNSAQECCSSCHEDESYGEDMIEGEFQGTPYKVCCRVQSLIKEGDEE